MNQIIRTIPLFGVPDVRRLRDILRDLLPPQYDGRINFRVDGLGEEVVCREVHLVVKNNQLEIVLEVERESKRCFLQSETNTNFY